MKKIKAILLWMTGASLIAAGSAGAAPDPEKFKRLKAMHDAYEVVQFDSLADAGLFSSGKVQITGYLLKAEGDGKAPAVVMSPACNGLVWKQKGIIRPYHMFLAKRLHEQGITVLMVDGFNPRGFESICSQSATERSIDMGVRVMDTMGALQYLKGRDDVDGGNIFLVGYGATGGLRLLNRNSDFYRNYGGGFAAAVMFFPQCESAGDKFAPYAPIQVFVGEKDAWNPPSECRALARRKMPMGAAFHLTVYPDTYHAFVKPTPPREVEGPPGVGRVMVGSNPEATKAAYQRTLEFMDSFIHPDS